MKDPAVAGAFGPKVEDLGLRKRDALCLQVEGIIFVSDLATTTEEELLKTPNINRAALKRINKALWARGLQLLQKRSEYLTALPDAIPGGMVLVHNRVKPARRLGTRGFRAWLEADSAKLKVCGCGWAPGLGRHFVYPP